MSSNAVACTSMVGPRLASERTSDRVFVSVFALLFVGCLALTIRWCDSMSAMGGMPMPGGWTMSMTWMRMPGQTWAGAMASFVGMWAVMMVAMMLPSFAPTMWRYRRDVFNADSRQHNWLTLLFAVVYFAVWSAIGIAVFPAGAFIADCTMRVPALARAVPVAAGIVVLLAGALQFTRWKAHHLACCRRVQTPSPNAAAALRNGLRFGLNCVCGCAGFTLFLLVMGVMDLRIMAAVTAAISAERLAPAGERAARIVGAIVVAAGLWMIVRAV